MSLLRKPGRVIPSFRALIAFVAMLAGIAFDGGHNLSWHRGNPGRAAKFDLMRRQALAGVAPSGGAEAPTASAERVLNLFEEFKTQNNERLAKLEKGEAVDALLEEHVNKLSAAIDLKMVEHRKALETQMAEQDATINRLRLGGGGNGEDETKLRAEAALWMSAINRERGAAVVTPEAVDLAEYAAYKGAYNKYLRRGLQQAGVQNALQVGIESDGGVWVTPDTSGRIATAIYETSELRGLANVQTISTDRLTGVIDADEASLGGWVGERSTRPGNTATPDLGTWEIPVHEQYAEPRATQILLDDAAVDVESWLNAKIADKLARTENTAFVTGDGIDKPRGFTTYAAGTASAATWNVIQQVVTGSAAALTTAGLIDLVFSMKQGYRAGATFGMARGTIAAVRKLVDGDGNYIWQPDFTQERSDRLVGYPVAELNDMAAVGADALPVVFANFGVSYQIVDRMGIRVLRDPFTTKGYVKFYTTKRVGGGVTNFEAIKLQKCST